MKYYSQNYQDYWVYTELNNYKNGYFVDIGAANGIFISNTYFLEKNLNWRGIGVDLDSTHKQGWEDNRTSLFVCGDATALDYKKILDENSMPHIIDYLSVDTDPPQVSFNSLVKIFESGYEFNVITFETDEYLHSHDSVEQISRNFLKDRGFVLVKTVQNQDDFYIHERLLNG